MNLSRKISVLILFLAVFAPLPAGHGFLLMSASSAYAEEALKAGDIDPKNGKKILYWVAPMDPTYIRNEPGKSPMGMDLVPKYEEEGGAKTPASTVIIDPITIQNMGVRLGKVGRAPLSKKIRAMGTVTYDERKLSTINTKFDGWIDRLYVNFVGEQVKRGQPLFDIYSPELVTAQEEYLLTLRQQRDLAGSDYEVVRESADRLVEASRRRLLYWDMSRGQIKRLEKTGKARKTVTIFSPTDGVVTEKEAVEGIFVKAGRPLYQIADLSSVWVDVEVYAYELPFIKKDMPAAMELAYLPGKPFTGKVLFIYPFLDPKTRTVRLRLEFPNPDGELKPGMYANAQLGFMVDDNALVVPQEAVIDSGERRIVFVSRGQGKFEPREVTLGAEGAGGLYHVLDGLSEGEEIVLSGQFLMDSESRLKEAVQKMLEVRNAPQATEKDQALNMDDLNMDSLDMDDLNMNNQDKNAKSPDLNMSGLSMDN